MTAISDEESRQDTYENLPSDIKSEHDSIAQMLGLDPLEMTQYNILKAIIVRIQALEPQLNRKSLTNKP